MSGCEVLKLAAELLAHYSARTRSAETREGYSRTQIKDQSEVWQEACDGAGQYREVLNDFLVVSATTGNTPLPINRTKFDRACDHLAAKGSEVAHRAANWRTAIRALLANAPHLVEEPDGFQDRRKKRSQKVADRLLLNLAADLDGWRRRVCAPLENSFAPVEPICALAANNVAGQIMRAAIELVEAEKIKPDIALIDLVTEDNFDAWRELDDGSSPATTLAKIDAFIRIRKDEYGDGPVVKHMRAQRVGLRDAHALSGSAVRQIAAMLSNPRRFELLPVALLEVARRDDLPAHVRLKLANQAPAMHAAIQYALTPAEIAGMTENEAGGFVPPTRGRDATLKSPDSVVLEHLLKQRRDIRTILGASANRDIMVSPSGARMSTKENCNALSRTQDQFGLIKHPWQRYRDYSAVRLLLAGKLSLDPVCVLLEIRNPELVHRRFAALIPRSSEASTSPLGPANEGRAA